MTLDERMKSLAAILRQVEATSTTLETIGPMASAMAAGRGRTLLVNLLIGADEARERLMARSRVLLREARAEVERECGPEAAAKHFMTMEARTDFALATGAMWRETMASLVAAAPVSGA
jgi:hypothetical protein